MELKSDVSLSRKLLTQPRLPYWVAGLACLVALPTVWSGWALDDYLLRTVMLGLPYGSFEPMDLFGIASGDPEVTVHYKDQGILPFWTPANFRISFFRPLTVFTAWLDFQLWPDSPTLMHLHSILWFSALVLVAGLLYRSTVGSMWVSGLAALLNGLDPARALPVAWISSRHVLISSLFGVLTLLLYDKWRSRKWVPGSVLAPCAFALALLAGEMALATICYLCAYALFLDRATPRSRLLALIPCFSVMVAWLLLYSALGHGAAGSGTYIDPLEDPATFLVSFVEHAPLLLVAEVTSIPADVATLAPISHPGVLQLVSVCLLLLVVLLASPMIRASAPARFWGTGMLLSLLPLASTLPSGRLLSFVALGAGALLALFAGGLADGAWFATSPTPFRRVVRASVVALVVTKLFIAPFTIPLAGRTLNAINESMVTAIRSIPDDGPIAEQELVILNPPDHLYYAAYIFAVNTLEAKPIPRRLRVLAAGPTEMAVFRVDTNTIRVRMSAGLYSGPFGRSFRSRSAPLLKGETIRVAALEAIPQELNSNGDPTEMIYRFPYVLEDGRLRWLRWLNGTGYVPFRLPAVGDSTALPPSEVPLAQL